MPSATPPPPGSDLDMQDPAVVTDLFDRAAELNRSTPEHQGSVVDLPDTGRLLMTGDLHDHGLNFHRILKLAKLHKSPENRLILHEIVHGPSRVNGRDLSIRMLAQVAALKCEYPEQVLLMQANHELAQLGGEGIVKDGESVVEAFDGGVEFLYGNDADDVLEAMNRYIRSLRLAMRCANGIFCSHSLPSPRKIDTFDKTVIDREPTEEDLAIGGDAYLMVWGRHHNQKIADELAKAWNVKVFLMGHQPADMGYEIEADTMLVLASDHGHGVAVPIDLSKTYDRDDLVEQIVPLASVVL